MTDDERMRLGRQPPRLAMAMPTKFAGLLRQSQANTGASHRKAEGK